MSTLVGKKYEFTAYNGKTVIEVIQELSPTQMLTKCLSSPYEESVGRFNVYDKNLNELWKEVREPRIIYVNEYEEQYYRHLGEIEDKNTFGVPRFSQQLAKKALINRPGITRKFIEVLE